MSGFNIREITRGLDPMSHAVRPRVTPTPRIGDRVTVTLPGGTKHPGVVTGRLYASETPFECRVAGALIYVRGEDVGLA